MKTRGSGSWPVRRTRGARGGDGQRPQDGPVDRRPEGSRAGATSEVVRRGSACPDSEALRGHPEACRGAGDRRRRHRRRRGPPRSPTSSSAPSRPIVRRPHACRRRQRCRLRPDDRRRHRRHRPPHHGRERGHVPHGGPHRASGARQLGMGRDDRPRSWASNEASGVTWNKTEFLPLPRAACRAGRRRDGRSPDAFTRFRQSLTPWRRWRVCDSDRRHLAIPNRSATCAAAPPSLTPGTPAAFPRSPRCRSMRSLRSSRCPGPSSRLPSRANLAARCSSRPA